MANLTNSQELELGVFGSLEPEPLEKKPGAGATWEKIRSQSRSHLKKKSGAGAAKKFAGSPALVSLFGQIGVLNIVLSHLFFFMHKSMCF